ncbi:M20/M25/M40 family metallo-hydrolase [Anaeromicrobium sediminis]|uniref:Peptidase M20 n=1 Tax=Anaeromicrobium sediminis TaxID=1478221 RepID=A0A267MIA9_9FIRM|nr:M20/M25/M40 family metallo-hydrolase [Anaeromicrobium sediminis]PAB58668.1 peptidase M20 [Anaeromicrobium sediminis]
MYMNCFEEVKNITKDLVSTPSIVRSLGGETNCARKIYEYYTELDYFKKYPDRVKMLKTVDDFVDRHSTYAYVKGTKGNSNRTIILLGHIDTVGVDDFGHIKEYAFSPDKLPELLMNMDISEEVREDILSGEYMFGRGALDMKSGVAGHMHLIKYFSEHPEELNGNIIAYAECDEEDGSHGVLTGLKEFKMLKEKEGFEYIACINADYSTGYNIGDVNRYVYFGSIGKLLPSFYVVGKEAHVGQAYSALDPNLIVAELTRLIELNTDLCDEAQGEITIPPMSLKQSDFKEGYTVQTALAAYAYYNFFTHSMSPADVIKVCREKAVEAFDNVIKYTNESYKKYCHMSNIEYRELPWKTRVKTWEEFYDELEKDHGEKFRKHIFDFAKELNEKEPTLDLRIFSVKVIEEAWKWSSDKSPSIIVFFGSVFSARIEMTGKTEKERELLDSVNNSIKKVQEHCENPIKVRMFYPYISDSSFMALSDDVETIETLGKNMPSWKTKYFYDVNEVLEINVPVVNIGTFGKDGHMITERVHMKYTFENVPNMTYSTICELLK